MPIKIGTEIYHIGNFRGEVYPDTVVKGIISHNKRNGFASYQCDMSVYPGASGGGIFLKDTGEYIGMIVSVDEKNMSISFGVSIEDIKIWADKNKLTDLIFEK